MGEKLTFYKELLGITRWIKSGLFEQAFDNSNWNFGPGCKYMLALFVKFHFSHENYEVGLKHLNLGGYFL